MPTDETQSYDPEQRPTRETHASSADQSLDEVIASYLRAVHAGEEADQSEWLVRYPDFARELSEFFADRQRVEEFTAPVRTAITAGPPVGSRVSYVGDYELQEELGRGGMGVVYKARQLTLKRTVALKMILAGSHASAQDVARFRAEAEAVARLQHPHIVQIHEIGEHEGHSYIALEFVEGGSFDKRLAGTPLPAQQAAQLMEILARAIHAAHQQGIVHRDLKPANVLLAASDRPQAIMLGSDTETAERHEPKVTDFGLAKLQNEEAGQTQTGAILGTPSYMAPEQAAGKGKEVGPSADVYALGAIMYECLTGRPPFRAPTPFDTLKQVISDEPVPPRLLNPKVPPDLETICLNCLEKEPHRRYASAQELADDLGRSLAGEAIHARPPSLPFAVRLWFRQSLRPTLWTVLVGLVSGLIAGVPIHLGLHFANAWILVVSALPFALCFLLQSLMAVLLVRPTNRAADVAVGAASGLVFGLTLFLLVVGPVAGREFVERATEKDLALLAEAAQRLPLGAADKERRAAFAAADPTEVLVYSYPHLRQVPPKERSRWLLRKIHADMRAGLFTSIWAGLAVSLLMVPWSIGSAVLTGGVIRRDKQPLADTTRRTALSRLEAGWVALLLAAPFIGLHLMWTLLSGGPEKFWASHLLLIGCLVTVVLVKRHRAEFNEALWKRHWLLSLALAASLFLSASRLAWPHVADRIPWFVDAIVIACTIAMIGHYCVRSMRLSRSKPTE